LDFIKPNGGGDSLFIHKEALSNRNRKPQDNNITTFSILKYQQVSKTKHNYD
jgi:cold shock CspA family protein